MAVILNPDKEFVAEMTKSLEDNNGFCPCALIQNSDTKCPCKEFRETDEGSCHCGLYIKTKERNHCNE